jgi:hypothetical protein
MKCFGKLALITLLFSLSYPAFAYNGDISPENRILSSTFQSGYVGHTQYEIKYPKVGDPVVRRSINDELKLCGPGMDDDPYTSDCKLEITGFTTSNHFLTLQITRWSEIMHDHMTLEVYAKEFVLTKSGYQALKDGDVLNHTDTCRHSVGEALIREAAEKTEEQPPGTEGVTPEEMFDTMGVWAIDKNRIEFVGLSEMDAARPYLTLSDEQLGDCPLLRRPKLRTKVKG